VGHGDDSGLLALSEQSGISLLTEYEAVLLVGLAAVPFMVEEVVVVEDDLRQFDVEAVDPAEGLELLEEKTQHVAVALGYIVLLATLRRPQRGFDDGDVVGEVDTIAA
jgi:hypothetical protein